MGRNRDREVSRVFWFWGKWIVFCCTPNKLDCETSQPQNGGLVQISFSIGWCLASKCEFSGWNGAYSPKRFLPHPFKPVFVPVCSPKDLEHHVFICFPRLSPSSPFFRATSRHLHIFLFLTTYGHCKKAMWGNRRLKGRHMVDLLQNDHFCFRETHSPKLGKQYYRYITATHSPSVLF